MRVKTDKMTHKEIAEKLGISAASVSFALGNKPGVSEKKKKMILDFIRENSPQYFEPDEIRPAIKYHAILMSVHNNYKELADDDSLFYNMLINAQKESIKHSFYVQISFFDAEQQNILEYVDSLRRAKVDGILIVTSGLTLKEKEAYYRLGLPMVVLGGINTSIGLKENIDLFEIEDFSVMERVVEYAYSKGHRHIGFIKGEPFNKKFEIHFEKYEKKLYSYGLKPSTILSLPRSVKGAYESMKEILNQKSISHKTTLYICQLDSIALGAMQAFKDSGYKVPEDVSFIGYGDIKLSLAINPALTTCQLNKAIAKSATNRLIQRISDPTMEMNVTHLLSQLVERDSVKSLKK